MRGRRLFDDYASLIFKYFYENSHDNIHDSAKTVRKIKSKVYRVLQRHISDTNYSQEKQTVGRPKKTDTIEDNQVVQKFATFGSVCPKITHKILPFVSFEMWLDDVGTDLKRNLLLRELSIVCCFIFSFCLFRQLLFLNNSVILCLPNFCFLQVSISAE